MKRNRYGINLDEGIPLDKEDYEILFVDCFGDSASKLSTWLKEGNSPVLLGGQIGSGKSTLIAKAFNDTGLCPDIVLHFDRDTLNLDSGDFIGIALAGFISTAIKRHVDLSGLNLPNELNPEQPGNWEALNEALSPNVFTMQSYALRKQVLKKIAENADYVSEAVVKIGKHIESCIGQQLLVFASGIDKFETTGAAWLAIEDMVKALSSFKTLFEVNAVHLFSPPGRPMYSLERILVPAASEDVVFEMLTKRLGVYAKPMTQELRALAELSGGNPRQALRLLTHFEESRESRTHSVADSILNAIRETTGDFFSFAKKPSSELMKVIKQTHKLGTNLFLLPGDKETARTALYGNWFFLSEALDKDSWNVRANPLVSFLFEKSISHEDPEFILLRRYAETYGMSHIGIGPSRITPESDYEIQQQQTAEYPLMKERSSEQLLWSFMVSGAELPLQCNLTELLDILSAALLSKDRPDRAIIAFKDKSITDAARAYLFAKANTYEYQRFEHTEISGGTGFDPLQALEEFFSKDTDIYSVEFSGIWTDSQLDVLDKHRDSLVNKQILLWIPFDNLKSYLPHWSQLRQLFEVLVLEDELLGSIKSEEIEADLAFFDDLVETVQSSEANLVSNLQKVLEYLKAVCPTGVVHG